MEAEPFYDQFAPREWERLERHRTEFAVTLRALDEFLSAPPYAVLNIGGGPGRYSIELARQGYTVTLLDISGESLRLARQKAAEAQVSLAGYIHGNALDLSELDESSFDAVLLMGPLLSKLMRTCAKSASSQHAKQPVPKRTSTEKGTYHEGRIRFL